MKKSSALESRCPACKRQLSDTEEIKRVRDDFQKSIEQQRAELSRTMKKDFDNILLDIKRKHRAELKQLKSRFQQQNIAVRKRFSNQLSGEKEARNRKLEEMRRSHQHSLQQTRDLYDAENLKAQKEQESRFNHDLTEILRNYSALASNYQKDLERLRKIQDDNAVTIRKVEAEIARLKVGIARSTADPQLAKLLNQLEERDVTIEDLRSKVTELEARLMAISQTLENSNRSAVAGAVSAVSPVAPAQTVGSPLPINQIVNKKRVESDEKGNNLTGPTQLTENKDVDPRELFVNAIKEINRSLKRPADKTNHEKPGSDQDTSQDHLGLGETVSGTRAKKDSNAGSTKSANFRKWFT
jgi:DNA repair exonuclease SbcCD ATPase subunit